MAGVFITGGLRTFLGTKGKAYKTVPAETLAAPVLKALHERGAEKHVGTDLVVCGNCVAGGGNMARLSLLSAGIPDSVPGISIDSQCSSGLESVITAYARVASGLNKAVIAGGTESTSTQCVRSWNKNHPNFRGTNNAYVSAQFIPDFFGENTMTEGADETCRKHGITGEDMIAHILESHARAHAAAEARVLEPLILPSPLLGADEGIKPALSERFLKRLPPLLPNGIITAGSCTAMSDGAAFVSVMDEKNALKMDSGTLFGIVSAVTVATHRLTSPESLPCAIAAVCEKARILPSRIDRIDYNEAFACIDILYSRAFDNPSNCYGGALAYGHPYAASGAVVLLHLMRAMERGHERYGIAAIPAAGAVASAVLIENMNYGR